MCKCKGNSVDLIFVDELQAIEVYKATTPPSMGRALEVMAMQVCAIVQSYERETGEPFDLKKILTARTS